ncbi:putative ribonuclease H-like domain-containing protein [Tanacetum coccineum]
MELESTNSGPTAKLPILKLGEYEMWVIRIKQYFQIQDYALWEVIENGDSWVSVPQTVQENGTSVTKMSIPVTAEEKTNKKNDVKARSLLLMALPNEHQLTFSYDAQEDLNSKFLSSLPPEWNTHVVVWMNKPEIETMTIDDLYNNFKIIKQKVKKYVGASSGAQNLAFMVAPSTSSTNDTNTASPQVTTASPNVNAASPQVSTASVSDNPVYAFMVENLNGSNVLHQDLEQIHKDDLEAMDLKWQLSLLSVRAKKYYQRTGKKIFINANDIVGYDKSKIECYNCHKLGHFSRECKAPRSKEGFDWSDMEEEQVQTNTDLMAFSDSELNESEFKATAYKIGLATFEDQIITYKKNEVLFSKEIGVLKREVACKDYEINVLKSKFEKVKQEKDGINFKIEKFDKASKDLDQLLGSQITDKSKKGLGYSAVPPPHPLIYNRPKKLNLSYSGLDEFKEPEFKGYGLENIEQESNVINYDNHQRRGIVSRNNYSRVDAKTIHPSIHRNMSPKAVLLKTDLTPLITVRLVNTAHLKTAVHRQVNAVRVKGVNAVKSLDIRFGDLLNLMGKPQHDDKGFVNSGCSRHMTGNIAYLLDFKEFDGGYVAFGGGAYGGRITGISKEVGTPRYLSLVVPLTKVGDEAVHKELGDRMERAATTTSSLEAEQDSGSGPRCQDTILGDVNAQTRFEITSKQSNDPPLSRGYTLGSGEDSMKLLELMELCTQLSYKNRKSVLFLLLVYFNAAKLMLMLLGSVNAARLMLMLPVQVPAAEESDGFAEIIDFLKASSVHYALTVNPIIYTSCIEQFWATAKVQTVNGVRQLQALVDKKRVIITESSIRRDLHLDDAEGTDCLPTVTIFEELARMGAKSTAWNEFSCSMASLIICLATNQKFNLSKYIFDAMVKHLDGGVKFLMYPCFLQVFINQQLGDMSTHKKIFVNPFHTKKVFANMKRPGKDFSRRITPLFDTMMVQASEEVGEDSNHPTDSTQEAEVSQDETEHEESVPTPSNDPQPSGEDSMQLTDLMVLCTKLQTQVLDLEKSKDAQAKEIAALKKRVQKLERKKTSRTTCLKRLKKVGMSRRVESSEDQESLGAPEDASKQGRSIADLDKDDDVTLVDETQVRRDDELMFDTRVLDADEMPVEAKVNEKDEQSTKLDDSTTGEAVTTASVEDSAAPTTIEEITLAQILIQIKAAKPKVVTTAATTTTTTRPKAKKGGELVQEKKAMKMKVKGSRMTAKGNNKEDA